MKLMNFQLALVFMVVLGANAAGAGTLGQETSSAPLQNGKILATGSRSPTAKTNTKKAATKRNPDQDKAATAQKPKRGQLVIAPIPITSPAWGAGLILAVGYVFKLNEEDNLSPQSVIGWLVLSQTTAVVAGA
jgi:hypothetical protein